MCVSDLYRASDYEEDPLKDEHVVDEETRENVMNGHLDGTRMLCGAQVKYLQAYASAADPPHIVCYWFQTFQSVSLFSKIGIVFDRFV